MWMRLHDLETPGPGEIASVKVGTRRLALANHGGRLCALDDRCPHAGASLSGGLIEEGQLVCPWHGRTYDLATGRCDGYEGVQAYPVEVRSDGVYVGIADQTPLR